MNKNRAIITYFDGDPFTMWVWLKLYQIYFADEVGKVYAGYNTGADLPVEVKVYNQTLLESFPNIYIFPGDFRIPEAANNAILKELPAEFAYVGLIESDGLIFQKTLVDTCFRLLEKEKQDIIASKYPLIDYPHAVGDLGVNGFMRNFFFVKRELLNKIDVDFMPHKVPMGERLLDGHPVSRDIELDCFGWVSLQLACLKPKITYFENPNVTPDNLFRFNGNAWRWLHIRQMSSSGLGMGGSEFDSWHKKDFSYLRKHLLYLFGGEFPRGSAEFTYIKSAAFKLLFWDLFPDKEKIPEFAYQYREALDLAIKYYALPEPKVYELKGYYRGALGI